MNNIPISAIILTYNGGKNIEECLKSICGWIDEIFVVDSYSTDMTLQIAKKYTDKIYQHPFENYSQQRNWAQDKLPLKNEWVFHLDQDEMVTPKLYTELKEIFSQSHIEPFGFLVSRKTIFMDRWIKHGGHYPVYHLRIFKRSVGRCEARGYHEHFIVQGKIQILKGDIIDIVASDLTSMVESHNRWASHEAKALTGLDGYAPVKAKFFGNPIERKKWLRNKMYKNLPLFLRPFLYFIYRYFLRLGFLDGREGLIFHFLQGFWQYFLIDAKIYEFRQKLNNK